jgi:hypothetical protein
MTIELAESQSTDVALVAQADAVGEALAAVVATNTTITQRVAAARELHERYKSVAFDVSTTKGMEQAKNARLMLRQERYPIQDLQKTGSKMLGSMQRQFNEQCRTFVEEIEGYERPIDEQIAAEEHRKEVARKEREEVETRRRQQHTSAIAAIAAMAGAAAGLDSAGLRERIEQVKGVIIDEGYEEFRVQAQQAKNEALQALNGMLVAALGDEQERAELERERQLQAQFREAAAARERDLAEREAALKRQQDELAAQQQELQRAREERAKAVQDRLDAIAWAGEPLAGRSSEELRGIRARVSGCMVTESLFGERTGEAENAIGQRTIAIDEAIRAAEDRERSAREAEVLAGLAEMRSLGELAPEVSPDAIMRRQARLNELTLLDHDEHQDAADQLAAEVRERLDAALPAAVERVRAAAIAAQREREAEAEAAAARALVERKKAHGEELYESVRTALLIGFERANLEAWALSATNLLTKINPEEDFDA